MYRVLVNAYAVAPSMGSEPGMGWNWIRCLAESCELYIITEGEWRAEIEASIDAAVKGDMTEESNPTHLTREQAERMHFYYLPVSERVRRMCWNQGDWRFYYYYRMWQKRALSLAREIMNEVDVDIVHQLNMIGFREPGMLWKIDDKPFVWGPVGGLELVPPRYIKDEKLKMRVAVRAKNIINRFQRRFLPRFIKAVKRADVLACSTKGVCEYIEKTFDIKAFLINETGSEVKNIEHANLSKNTLDIMWVGKFDFRKQLPVALHTMALLKDCPEIKLHVYGTGNEHNVSVCRQLACDLGVESSVCFYGSRPVSEVHDAMKQNDLLLFTSIMDATSTVVLEAVGRGLPVICLDTCGFGPIIDEGIGRKIPVSDPVKNAEEFSRIIRNLNADRSVIREMSRNCLIKRSCLSWESNAQKMLVLYDIAVEQFHNRP